MENQGCRKIGQGFHLGTHQVPSPVSTGGTVASKLQLIYNEGVS